jgi:hypothetical protein
MRPMTLDELRDHLVAFCFVVNTEVRIVTILPNKDSG